MVKNGSPNYPLESVDRALALLSLFGKRPAFSLSEVADELGVTRSTAHRILAMFVWRGYASQDPQTKAYRVGPDLIGLALAILHEMTFVERSHRVIRELAGELGETVHLAVLNQTHVSYIDGIESDKALRAAARIGMSMPAHATAAGKVLLARLPRTELRDLYRESRLERLTSHTVTRLAALEDELEEVRRRGYATNREESEIGLVSVAGYLSDPSNLAQPAIAIALPSVRADKGHIERLGEHLLRKISCESAPPSGSPGSTR